MLNRGLHVIWVHTDIECLKSEIFHESVKY